MGEVVELGEEVDRLRDGDRDLVPFPISCRGCFFCQRGEFSLCDNSNPTPQMAELAYGACPAGLYGYSHAYGGYAGGQAEYARVPYADTGAFPVPPALPDEKVLFLTDVVPTGWQAALNGNVAQGDVVAVWGCGPVGQLAIRSALLQGARQVLAIDRHPGRLRLAERAGPVFGLDYEAVRIGPALRDLTGGRGPDVCIDAVGLEAHGTSAGARVERAKTRMHLATDRGQVLREAIHACRKGGTISIPGVYGGFLNRFPMGAVFAKGLTLRAGQTHVHRYLPLLLDLVQREELDPSVIVSHRLGLEDAPVAYRCFRDLPDEWTKVILTP
jgi:threonine dehydrogenase-like Zn-dependent dehydrogenase